MAVTSNDILNRAILLIGDNQESVSGQYPNFDQSAAGQAANELYGSVVQTVARRFGWDFSRNVAALTLTGNAAPLGWSYEYAYPTNGIQVNQLAPQAISDANDPLPQNWTTGYTTVAAVLTKVIWSNLQNAQAIITGQPPEALWDALFTEEVQRLLASELAMALEGKPDTSELALETSETFGQIGQTREN